MPIPACADKLRRELQDRSSGGGPGPVAAGPGPPPAAKDCSQSLPATPVMEGLLSSSEGREATAATAVNSPQPQQKKGASKKSKAGEQEVCNWITMSNEFNG